MTRPRKLSECFASQHNTKAVATLKYFVTHLKFLMYDADPNEKIMGTLTRSGQTQPKC